MTATDPLSAAVEVTDETKAAERDGLWPTEIPEAVLWTKIHIYTVFLNYHNPKFNYPKYKKNTLLDVF